MANKYHLEILKRGIPVWNKWRKENPQETPDLSKVTFSLEYQNLVEVDFSKAILHDANLSHLNIKNANLNNADLRESNLAQCILNESSLVETNLFKADLSGSNLINADFTKASLIGANLSRSYSPKAIFANADLAKADLSHADLPEAIFRKANLQSANLSFTNLSGAFFVEANLTGATLNYARLEETSFMKAVLRNANLERAILVKSILTEADISESNVYGISAWDNNLDNIKQNDLVITPRTPALDNQFITVDNLEVSQFIYLLNENKKISDIINIATKKIVFILGRFTPERYNVLVNIKNELRKLNYLPILFDFKGPSNINILDTVSTIAHLSRFVIADMTDPVYAPFEIGDILNHISIPVKPILLKGSKDYNSFIGILTELKKKYRYLRPVYSYESPSELISSLLDKVIIPAERAIEERLRT